MTTHPPDSPSLGKSQGNNGSSPGSRSQPSWKSVFRFPNSSAKKLTSYGSSSETKTMSHPPVCYNVAPIVPNPSMAPGSDLSDQRSSYNSSNTQSSDSNGVLYSGSRYGTQRKDIYPLYTSPKFSDTSLGSRQHTKSEKTRPITNLSRIKPQAGNTPQLSYPATATTPTFPRSRTYAPLSPKSVGASASRFIRRVASAPNAKGLFSIGAKPVPATTRNGLLAPIDTISPHPPLISSSTEQGMDSLETISSVSSRRQRSRTIHPPTASYGKPTGLAQPPAPGKTAFRRTYSSNSIKVRQVGYHMIGQLPSSYIIHPSLR